MQVAFIHDPSNKKYNNEQIKKSITIDKNYGVYIYLPPKNI